MERIGGYKILKQSLPHFLTLTVVDWIDVFTRYAYREVLFDSIRYCQKEKGLLVHAWCLMSNHIHLIAASKENNLSGWLRDFKQYTSKNIFSKMLTYSNEPRREWMLDVFYKHGSKNSRNEKAQIWQQHNCPQELYSSSFIFQKMNYIHQNPVKAGIVDQAWDYKLSSVRDYKEKRKCGLLEVSFI